MINDEYLIIVDHSNFSNQYAVDTRYTVNTRSEGIIIVLAITITRNTQPILVIPMKIIKTSETFILLN